MATMITITHRKYKQTRLSDVSELDKSSKNSVLLIKEALLRLSDQETINI